MFATMRSKGLHGYVRIKRDKSCLQEGSLEITLKRQKGAHLWQTHMAYGRLLCVRYFFFTSG